MSENTLPELLAPAGSPACALAAFDAGADAIYAGLAKFNARERGENFTPERMASVVDYAHKLGRKVYLTLNTLIREAELPEIVENLAQIAEIGPDALLVQDLGVIRIVREYFPQLVLHGSTQMGIHNAPGFTAARKLGLSRIVLERQVTLDELRAIRKQTDMEIEVFIHGALCCSLSGGCLLSSWLGGYSGNRGKCKQPCRRRYYSAKGNGFFLSPQDLCGAELIPELRQIGVASLKIEGRLRQPDYVASTVQAYRMLLDSSNDPTQFAAKLPEARNLLSKGCGRKWSSGFYSEKSMHDLIKFDAMGAAGMRCGALEEIRGNGFVFTTGKRLFLGDRLRVQPVSGDDGIAVTLTKMFVEGLPARRALPGQSVFVCCDKEVPERGMVFKIGESFPDFQKRIEALPPRREKLALSLTLSSEKIEIRSLNAPLDPWCAKLNLRPAERRPADAEQLRTAFSASDSPDFMLGDFEFHCQEKLFFPAPELKEVRRNFWKFVTENLRPGQTSSPSAGTLDRFRTDYLALKPNYVLPERLIETVALKPHGQEPADRRALRADNVFDVNKLTNEAILPEFCPENRLPALRKAISAAYRAGVRRFRVTSLYGFALLRDFDDLQLSVSLPLPVCNSMAALELLEQFGVEKVMAHPELARADIEALKEHSAVPLECYRLGRLPLLTSRASLPLEGPFRDARGNEFELRTDAKDRLARVFSRQVMSLPHLSGIYDFYDLRNATWRSEDTAVFNFDSAWV